MAQGQAACLTMRRESTPLLEQEHQGRNSAGGEELHGREELRGASLKEEVTGRSIDGL